MNQKNIFSVIGVVLILQGLAFMFMKNQIVTSSFPTLDEAGHNASAVLMEVLAALSILVGLVTYASRSSSNVVWAFTLGFLVLGAVTFKHNFIDHVAVPVPAMIIQLLTILACLYLWLGKKG